MTKKTHEKYLSQITERYKDEYNLLGIYTGADKKIEVQHLKCGHIWLPTSANLLQGRSKCPKCSGKHHRSPQEFCEFVLEKTNGEFSSMGDFKGNNYTTTFKHNVCGHVFKAKPQTFLKGEIGCRKCSNMLIHDKERVELLLEDKYGNEYTLLSDEVKNNRDVIIILHNVCKKEFETTSNRIININITCSHCKPSGSKGEMEIGRLLKQNSINFIREYTFDDCRHKSILFFDFAIFDHNDSLIGLIEFDGKQHFEPIDFFGGLEGFKTNKIRDGIKNNYCKKNNIPLIRIPYWEEDSIEVYVNDFLKGLCINC